MPDLVTWCRGQLPAVVMTRRRRLLRKVLGRFAFALAAAALAIDDFSEFGFSRWLLFGVGCSLLSLPGSVHLFRKWWSGEDPGPAFGDYPEAAMAALEQAADLDDDARVEIREVWLDRERYERGAVCIVYVDSTRPEFAGKLLGLDWDLTGDPDGLYRRRIRASKMGEQIYCHQIRDPRKRELAEAKLVADVYWFTKAAEPPSRQRPVRTEEGPAT